MASRRVEENRVAYQRYKEDVKRDGKPFYPYAMFHDTVMSLVVVCVIGGLAFGIPTILLILALAIPFIDVRRERRLIRRPIAIVGAVLVALSMGVLTYKGATAKEPLGAELLADVPNWVKTEKLPPAALPGAKLFATSGCLNCHTYNGAGGSQLGAPDLSAEGSKNKGIAFQIAHLKCPSCVNKGSPMPSFADFGDANLRKLAIFLEASKGPK
jgi:mono/diheme cytochrome c family protein